MQGRIIYSGAGEEVRVVGVVTRRSIVGHYVRGTRSDRNGRVKADLLPTGGALIHKSGGRELRAAGSPQVSHVCPHVGNALVESHSRDIAIDIGPEPHSEFGRPGIS